ncbi:MAG: PD40 domain-containing protein [Anaerolineae bacterium]|nr:PD40 domain-containing protein [Anaerolineae bacterium]
MNATRRIVSILLLCVLMAGCGSAATTESTITETDAPTETATTTSTATLVEPTVIPTSAHTPPQKLTLTPTLTPSLTFTPAPTSSVPLSDTGPWLITLVSSPDGRHVLYAMNPDWTGRTELISGYFYKTFAFRPGDDLEDGVTIAYITRHYEHQPDGWLNIAHVPGGDEVRIAQVSDEDDATYYQEFVWSPDGTKLAYTAAVEDGTFDLYVYDLATESITRLTDEVEKHIYRLEWSPDGDYILYMPTDLIFHSGGPYPDGFWSVRVDDGVRAPLFDVSIADDLASAEADISYSWINDHQIEVKVEYFYYAKEYKYTYLADITTGDRTPIADDTIEAPEEFIVYAQAYAEEHDLLLFSEFCSTLNDECEPSIYLYRDGDINEYPAVQFLWFKWFAEYDLFVGTSWDYWYTISPSGVITEMPGEIEPVLEIQTSPDGNIWLWHSKDSNFLISALWLSVPLGEPKFIFSSDEMFDYVKDYLWTLDGNGVLFLLPDQRCEAYPPEFELECVPMDNTGLQSAFWLR